jgi:hypothetical protein
MNIPSYIYLKGNLYLDKPFYLEFRVKKIAPAKKIDKTMGFWGVVKNGT